MIPLLKVHEYYRVEGVVTNEKLERIEKLEDINYSLRRNRYGYPLSNEKV